jgi:GNAT superfamily N-acetyltransferase
MIRTATKDDIPRILELGNLLHKTSSFSHLPFDEAKVEALMRNIMDGAGVVFVSEVDGIIIGGIAGGVTEFWFCGERIGFDYSFFIHPDFRGGMSAPRLIIAFKEWARLNGAIEIHMGVTTGIHTEATGRLYEKMGFRLAGPLYKMEV